VNKAIHNNHCSFLYAEYMNIGPHDWKNEVEVWPTSQLRLGHDNSVLVGCHGEMEQTRACLVAIQSKKVCTVLVTSNLAVHVWSTKCRRKKKLITQFSCKSRDKSFEPN
jgi:hypothetical protein